MVFLLPQTDRITARSNKKTENRIIEAQFGNGYKQIADDGINASLDTWIIHMAPLEGDNLTQIRSFLDTVGVVEWFQWTPLGEATAKNWRVIANSTKWTLINTTKFIVEFQMLQHFVPPAEFTNEFTSEFW